MKDYNIVIRTKSDCSCCDDDEHEFLVQDFGDRLLSYMDGKPTIFQTWDDLFKTLPHNYEIKENV